MIVTPHPRGRDARSQHSIALRRGCPRSGTPPHRGEERFPPPIRSDPRGERVGTNRPPPRPRSPAGAWTARSPPGRRPGCPPRGHPSRASSPGRAARTRRRRGAGASGRPRRRWPPASRLKPRCLTVPIGQRNAGPRRHHGDGKRMAKCPPWFAGAETEVARKPAGIRGGLPKRPARVVARWENSHRDRKHAVHAYRHSIIIPLVRFLRMGNVAVRSGVGLNLGTRGRT